MSIKILYLPKNFIPPQNRSLATPLIVANANRFLSANQTSLRDYFEQLSLARLIASVRSSVGVSLNQDRGEMIHTTEDYATGRVE